MTTTYFTISARGTEWLNSASAEHSWGIVGSDCCGDSSGSIQRSTTCGQFVLPRCGPYNPSGVAGYPCFPRSLMVKNAKRSPPMGKCAPAYSTTDTSIYKVTSLQLTARPQSFLSLANRGVLLLFYQNSFPLLATYHSIRCCYTRWSAPSLSSSLELFVLDNRL